MNLDPTGSPRHEQTVAVALILIVAQVLRQPVLRQVHGSNLSNRLNALQRSGGTQSILSKVQFPRADI
jgi:hypothetical protein